MSTTPQFEIPTDMRKMAEQSLEQVRTAINGYLEFFQRGVPGDVMGGSELSNKVFGYAERNVASAFEFAERMVRVRDVQDLTQAADGIHPSANAGDDRAGQGPERDHDQGADGQRENPDKRRPIVLIATDKHGDHSVRSIATLRGRSRAPRQMRRPGKPS